MLVHLRTAAVKSGATPRSERLLMAALSRAFASPRGFERLQRLGEVLQRWLPRDHRMARVPGPVGRWTRTRDLPPAASPFRSWWKTERDDGR